VLQALKQAPSIGKASRSRNSSPGLPDRARMADRRTRCVSMLAQLGGTSALPRGIDTMIAGQHKDGSWFGRWA
jgi:hypothetical protein